MISKEKKKGGVPLIPVTEAVIEAHGLTKEEYEKIKRILGREPNLTEVGVFSVMWSEHCSYKSSRPLLGMLPKDKRNESEVGKVLVRAGEENAGVIDIGEGWAVCFKIESHNHPSAVEPFEGAATGVGGIIRDIFTMGARPVLLTNSLRFGELESKEVQRLFRGVVSGIGHYGNCIGIPNVGGDIYFDKCYEGNPLVNALCLGVLKHEDIKRGAAKGIGNPVYYVGAPTGRDGLGGASFASKDLSEESAEDRPAVQKGDPFMEKLLMEACLEMMAVPGLVVGIQDMGAAGLTCSACETASRGGTGVIINLDKVPAREEGMSGYEYLLSESQERMLVIVEKGRESELEAIFKKWDLAAVQIGEVTEGDRMVVTHGGDIIVDVPAKALTDDGPVYQLESKEPDDLRERQEWDLESIEDIPLEGIEGVLNKLLAEPTIASKRWVWRQYDHMVMANTVVEPGSDAGVVRVGMEGGKERFVAISNDCNNRYCVANPYGGAQIAVLEAMRNLVCSGAKPLGLTNNLNFGNPNKPESFYYLKECVRGLAEACEYFDLPVVGGNVSLYNENEDGSIDPTPVVSVVGLIEEARFITKQSVQEPGEVLILLGGWPRELGASMYLKVQHGVKVGNAPIVDMEAEKRLQDFLLGQIKEGRIRSAHDLSEGGLLVALAEMLFDKGIGAAIDLSSAKGIRRDALLFGESQGRVIISIKEEDLENIVSHADKMGVACAVLGRTENGGDLKVKINEGQEQAYRIGALRKIWSQSIPQVMNPKLVKNE